MKNKKEIIDESNSKAPICKYCGKKTFLTSFFLRNNKKYAKWKSPGGNRKLIYVCPKCGRYVNVHKGTNEPMGFPGDRELRLWRTLTHHVFDQLWNKKGGRKKSYIWLAKKMKLDIDECHVGMFDEDMCKKAIDICVKELSKR